MSAGLIDMDCGPKCRSKKHALQMITAVTKGNCRQTRLFLSKCHNVASLRDVYGRTVLHVASSCGKVDTIQWLLSEREVDLGVKDIESGWTALHRALFYGQLSAARILIAHGASLEVIDKEGLAPLDLIMKDRLPHVSFHPSGPCDVYTWGDNSNYTLGQENEQKRRNPECVELFRKKQLSIMQVIICKYHSTFLTTSGIVFTCGNGHGGRLGHGDQQTCLVPRLVESLKEEVCIQLTAARDHTMFLTQSGTIYSCGLNGHRQLGILPPPDCCLLPKPLSAKQLRGHHIESVHALRFHSVIHTTDAVFTFGRNAGQLGHQKVAGDPFVAHPRLVSALNHKDTCIKLVAASDAATVVITTKGDVFALYKYRCRKVASRCDDIVQVGATGGSLDSDVVSTLEQTSSDLVILLLSSSHRMCIWQESSPVLRWCSWSLRRPLDICQFALGDSKVAFVTPDGEAFLASVSKVCARNDDRSTIKARKCDKPKSEAPLEAAMSGGDGPAPTNAFITMGSDVAFRHETEEIAVSKLAMVHRATAIALDEKARNLAVLQTQPNASLTEIPDVRDSEMGENCRHLLEEADISDDICDVILQVGPRHQPIAAHKFVLASQSEYFRHEFCMDLTKQDTVRDSPQKDIVKLHDVDSESFAEILRFIYTGKCKIPASKVNRSENGDYTTDQSCEQASSSNPSGKESAYNVYKTQNEERQKRSKVKLKDHDFVSPFTTMLELSRRFGVRQLTKRLEALRGVRGSITEISPRLNVTFNRRDHQCLYDVCIEAEDHSIIQCHKCVLVARLDYFRSMLSSGWIEASDAKSLSLPIERNILKLVIDYLYVDSASVLSGCHGTDLLCSVLTVADQLLIGRLKDMCQVAIAALMNLKNACDLLQFATVYSAHQLKTSCHQFITINAAALLEARSLDVLTEDVIDELGAYYRDTVPGMSRRMLTPYDGWPDMSYLESLEAELTDVMIDSSGRGGVRTVKRSKKRRRTRSSQGDEEPGAGRTTYGRLSMSSDTRDQVEEGEEEDCQDVPVSPCANGTAHRHMTQHSDTIGPAHHHVTQHADTIGPAKGVSGGLRDVIAEEEMKCEDMNASSHGLCSSNRNAVRLSQKQRKKLTRESVSTTDAPNDAAQPQASSNPWGVSQTVAVVESFKELQIQAEDKNKGKLLSEGRAIPRLPSESKAFPRLSVGSCVASWGLSTINQKSDEATGEPGSPTSPVWLSHDVAPPCVNGGVSFTEIVEEEQEQREARQRAANKPLSLIQIEEQAMSELLRHYRAGASGDYRVSVERVTTSLASPVWDKQQWRGPH